MEASIYDLNWLLEIYIYNYELLLFTLYSSLLQYLRPGIEIAVRLFLVASYLVLQCAIAQEAATPTVQPVEFSGEEAPYHVILTGTDIPPRSSSTDVSTQNSIGTWLYRYTGCKKLSAPEPREKLTMPIMRHGSFPIHLGSLLTLIGTVLLHLNFWGVQGSTKKSSLRSKQFLRTQLQSFTVTKILSNTISRFDAMIRTNIARTGQIRTHANLSRVSPQIRLINALLKYSSPPKSSNIPKPTLLAYAGNHDKNVTNYPMIDLCKGFFDGRNLKDAITYWKALQSPGNLRLSTYENRWQIFLVRVHGNPWRRDKFAD